MARSRIGWVLLGAGLALALWAVLAAVLMPLGARVGRALADLPADAPVLALSSQLSAGRQAVVLAATAGPLWLGFLLATGASAYLVARMEAHQTRRLGPAVGVSAAGIAWALAAALGSLPGTAASLFALGVLAVSGFTGGWLGALIAHRAHR